eukprot:CAMPEP_0114489670 /NCGR_PEP_ID=MMETSP0109-20121206/2018_1 /TAXON_ID=29199 /ORGANISM="Chlorarachnion reptans, Strain CCCM449" /LENGTH=115 /DNA_ID=CAMNT_0001666207 /DNA_START=398 /DNA_END=742 /DNA_ORIENTATION=+
MSRHGPNFRILLGHSFRTQTPFRKLNGADKGPTVRLVAVALALEPLAPLPRTQLDHAFWVIHTQRAESLQSRQTSRDKRHHQREEGSNALEPASLRVVIQRPVHPVDRAHALRGG